MLIQSLDSGAREQGGEEEGADRGQKERGGTQTQYTPQYSQSFTFRGNSTFIIIDW